MQGQPGFFNDEPMQASSSDNGPGPSADRNAGVPSTSGADSDVTSEDEVVRLLNCSDYYSALGLTWHQNIDVSILKQEYRKKAMLVHPDKNMGNEKAAEAFKKLQNAHEVLIDSVKQKVYDDELRREELLSVFHRFHNASRKNVRHGFFASGFARSDADSEDPLGEETMTEEEFYVWLQNAVQAGMFDNFSGSTATESPSTNSGNGTKNFGNSSGGGGSSKRKKKGRKQL